MKRANKYNAKKVVIEGHTFDSQKEGRRYNELRLLERAGEIRNLELKPVFPIVINGKKVKMKNGRVAKYTADFSYFEGEERVVEEVKGFRVRDYPLRCAVVEAIYNIKIREV